MIAQMDDTEETKRRFNLRNLLKKPGKNMFWAWIAYQSIKGMLTLSFIWIPLIYMWFTK